MKQFLIFLSIAAFIIACGGEDNSSKKLANNTPKKEAKKGPNGSKIYKQYCVVCHGIGGDMGASGAFDLTATELSLDEKIAVVTNGRNAMTPFKDVLDADEIKAVAEYTESLKK